MGRYDHVFAYREAFNERKRTVKLSDEGRETLEFSLRAAQRHVNSAQRRLSMAQETVLTIRAELAAAEQSVVNLKRDLGIES